MRAQALATGAGSRLSSPAARSMLAEVLVAEFAGSLPRPLAERAQAADSPGTLNDLLVAGSAYRIFANDPRLSRALLKRLDANPRAAVEALAAALRAELEPSIDPARDFCDRLGLMLQLSAAAVLLVARLVVFNFLAGLMGAPATAIVPVDHLRSLFGLDLAAAARPAGLATPVWLSLAVVWASLEAAFGPRLLEALRRLPARLCRVAPSLAGRVDAFAVVWRVQGVVVFVSVLVALGRALAPVIRASAKALL
jgi:hypothetical protein